MKQKKIQQNTKCYKKKWQKPDKKMLIPLSKKFFRLFAVNSYLGF